MRHARSGPSRRGRLTRAQGGVRVPAGRETEAASIAAYGSGVVGARGIAPPPTTFRSRCASPSRRCPSTWSAAHDATAVPPRRARHRPGGRGGRRSPRRRIGEGGRPPPRPVALDREAPPGERPVEGGGGDDGAARVDPGAAAAGARGYGSAGRRRSLDGAFPDSATRAPSNSRASVAVVHATDSSCCQPVASTMSGTRRRAIALAFDHGRYVRVADGATMRSGACYLLAGMPPSCRISPATSRIDFQ